MTLIIWIAIAVAIAIGLWNTPRRKPAPPRELFPSLKKD